MKKLLLLAVLCSFTFASASSLKESSIIINEAVVPATITLEEDLQ